MSSNHADEFQLSHREQQELLALADRIIDSGVLGKSKVYCRILRYLVDCTVRGVSPKETSIAIDVLERDTDFDISRDSIVRVHMYQLRSKLEKYFKEYGANEKLHLAIPKGQYGISITPGPAMGPEELAAEASEPASVPQTRSAGMGSRYGALILAALGALTVALVLNLYFLLAPAAAPQQASVGAPPGDPFTSFGFWSNIFDDDMAVLILVGDYYIFGERDADGAVTRMVRDFQINSSADFAQRAGTDPAFGIHHTNLNMSYIPTGTATALAELATFLGSRERSVQVKLMSELDTADLVSHHIIYLGLFSGLDRLHDLMFAASGLHIGATYDELHAVESGAYYPGSYNNPLASGGFRDYGILSAFTTPRGNQFIMLTGMRDAGLLNTVEQAIDLASLGALQSALQVTPPAMIAFEALYEVTGLQSTNFHTRLVHHQLLDSAIIWETQLVRTYPQH